MRSPRESSWVCTTPARASLTGEIRLSCLTDRLTGIRTYVRCLSHAPSPPAFRLLTALGERRRAAEAARRPGPRAGRGPADRRGLRRRPSASECGRGCGWARRSRAARARAGPARPRAGRARLGGALRGLEGIGAEVESERPGEAFFEAGGLRRLWGGIDGVLASARGAAGMPVRLAAAPGRFCSYAAARRARARSTAGGDPRRRRARFLAPLPVSLLHGRLRAPPGGMPSRARPTTSPTSWSASASRRSAGSPSCRAMPSPTASARSGCARCAWPGVRTSRCARAAPTRSWRSSWSCPRRPRASSSSARWSC